ncbi:MAG TPA: beta-ketoacyl reductase, partial [Chloroflexota bacterium]|nr:beta-ketoacyl reductase [Chloroflexota bacterium]
VAAEHQRLAVAQAPVWGLGRVAALEHPELWGGLVDLDPHASPDEAAWLLAEIESAGDEDQIAYRQGHRYVARLAHSSAAAPAAAPVRLHADGAYLITGGLGGIGLKVAHWMAEQGARHIVLLGRGGLPARSTWTALPRDHAAFERVVAVRALEERGVTVVIAQADVADLVQMGAVMEQFGRTQPRLRGIVHAAGVAELQSMRAIDSDALRRVLRPKVTGSWVLHQLTEGLDLDFFVLFSSAAAVWGSRAMAHYAGANHFLDACAHYRRVLGLPALSINWGRWPRGGKMSSADEERLFSQIGLEVMSTDQALEAMAYLLGTETVQQTVAAVDWRVFVPIYEAKRRRPFLERLALNRDQTAERPQRAVPEFVARLAEAPPNRRRSLLATHVHQAVSSVLGLPPAHRLEPRQGFFQIGMDSLTAVELKNRLQKTLGQQLPSTLAFDYPNVVDLVDYLAREMLPVTPAMDPLAVEHAEDERHAVPAELEHLSEDELVALLAGELATIDEKKQR